MEQGDEGKEIPRKGLVDAVESLLICINWRAASGDFNLAVACKDVRAALQDVHEVAGFQDEHGVIHHVYADNFAHGCIADMGARLMAYEQAERGSH